MILDDRLRQLPADTPAEWLDQALDVVLATNTDDAENAWRRVVLKGRVRRSDQLSPVCGGPVQGGPMTADVPNYSWVEQTQTVDAIDDTTVRALDANPCWKLLAVGVGSGGQTTLTYGWPWERTDR